MAVHSIAIRIAYPFYDTRTFQSWVARWAVVNSEGGEDPKAGWVPHLPSTYTTLLTQNNEEVKVVQELLRHANSRITLDLYAQAGMPNKRLAQSKLVRMVLNKGEALA